MANEKRLIHLEDALKAISSEYLEGTLPEHDLALLLTARRKLKNLPTVDAVEVVHSQWDTVFYERNGTLASYSHLCPECKYFYRDVRFKGHSYCPNCGAKMDLEVQPCQT